MAKFAFGKRDSEGRESAPVSRHPAFPAIVALWFAALLGLGSLLLPPVLFEHLIEAAGLAAFVPPAAPPLGLTARLLIGFGCALFGALLGFSVARRVANAHVSPLEPRLMQQAPIETGGESGSAGESATGHEELELDCDIEIIAAPAIDWRASEQPYGVPEMTETHEAWPDPDLGNWQFPLESAPEDAELEAPLKPAVDLEPELATEPFFEQPEVHCDLNEASLQDVPLPKLVERLALTIRKRRDWLDAARSAAPAEAPRPATLDSAPGEEATQAMAAWFGTSTLSEAPPSNPEPTSQPSAPLRPAFLDWFDGVEQEDDEIPAPSFSLPPLAPLAVAEFEPSAEDEELGPESDEAAADEDAYGSLIGMKNPFAPPRSDYIRIVEGEEDPEAEPETAEWAEDEQEQPDRIETDAALRAALASLQRISGAA